MHTLTCAGVHIYVYNLCEFSQGLITRTKRGNGLIKIMAEGFPGGAVVKNLPANAGDTGSSPGPGRSHMLWSN